MCISNPMSMSSPASSVDASTQPIKSKYELSAENKRRNAEIKRRQQSLVSFTTENEPSSSPFGGNYQVGTTGTFRPQSAAQKFSSKTGLTNVG